MKGIFYVLMSVILAGTMFSSCEEDIDLIGDFQETAVVYGLLNKADTVHFIKINRAFIGPGNSLEIAQNPDSSYFNQVDATITEYIDGNQVRVWTLEDTLIENKETSGVFYAPEQKVYYFKTTSAAPLDANGIYKLRISINGGEFEVEGETEIVSGLTTSADPQNYRYEFMRDPDGYVQRGISVTTGNSHVINTTLRVKMVEIIPGVDTSFVSFDWSLGEAEVSPNASKTFTTSGQTFYELVASKVTTSNPLITERRLYSIKIISTGGAEDLYNYMTVNKPTSSLAQNKPTYTNLTVSTGHRVIGVFSSRYTHSSEKFYINPSNTSLRMITQRSVEELCIGPITGLLYFCSNHPQDIATSVSYACP